MAISSKTLRLALVAATALMGVTACKTQPSDPPLFYKNPIQVAESVERLELYSRPNGMSLSARDSDAVAGFLSGFARYGEGPLYVNMPSGGNAGTAQTRQIINTMLGQMGINGAPVQEGQYRSAANSPAPVVISYRRLKALPRNCSIQQGLQETYNNQTYHNFGCVASANLAAMIDDPRQLLEPYDFAAPDMRRRMTVYDKYIKGESTGSAIPNGQSVSSTSN